MQIVRSTKVRRILQLSIIAAFVYLYTYHIVVLLQSEWKSVVANPAYNFWQTRIVTKFDVDAGQWVPKNPVLDQSFEALNHTSSKHVFLAGVLRDNARALPKSLLLVDMISSFFNKSTVALYENDSKDQTPVILQEWSRNHPNAANIHIMTEELQLPPAMTFGGISEGRFSRLASCRNKYLDIFQKHASDADYVVIIDMDLFDMTADAFLSNFTPDALAHDWSIVGANGVCSKRRHYDTLAMRTDKFQNTRIWEQALQLNRVFEPSEPWLPVTSVFGGMAIYRGSCVGACRYEADGDCEHVSFNNCVRKQPGCANAFMNPGFLLDYGFWTREDIAHYFPGQLTNETLPLFHPVNGMQI